jgi:N-6 DNA Methylase
MSVRDPKPGEILLDPACGTGGFLTCAGRHMRERYVKSDLVVALVPSCAVVLRPVSGEGGAWRRYQRHR